MLKCYNFSANVFILVIFDKKMKGNFFIYGNESHWQVQIACLRCPCYHASSSWCRSLAAPIYEEHFECYGRIYFDIGQGR